MQLRIKAKGPLCPHCKVPTYQTRLIFQISKKEELRWVCLKCGYSEMREEESDRDA